MLPNFQEASVMWVVTRANKQQNLADPKAPTLPL